MSLFRRSASSFDLLNVVNSHGHPDSTIHIELRSLHSDGANHEPLDRMRRQNSSNSHELLGRRVISDLRSCCHVQGLQVGDWGKRD